MEEGHFRSYELEDSPEQDLDVRLAKRKRSKEAGNVENEKLGLLSLRATEKLPESKSENVGINARTASVEKLLAVAGQIKIESVSLREAYEAGAVSERGLRRLVEAYQTGGDIKRTLAEERLIKQLSFERDPKLRDQLLSEVGSKPLPQNHNYQETVQEPESKLTQRPTKRAKRKRVSQTTSRIKGSYVPSSIIIANTIAVVILGILLLVLITILIRKN